MTELEQKMKCVAVIDRELPIGIAANTAAILGCTLGKRVGTLVGEDVVDCDQNRHVGIINTPLPILTAPQERLKEIYQTAYATYSDQILLIDFSDLAQHCKSYEDYTENMARIPVERLNYLGLCLYGVKKAVNHLTGNLPTLK